MRSSDLSRIRYPDPLIKVNDTVKVDLATGKITDFIQFDSGVIAMATGGRNMGRVGVITHRERHDGGFNIVHIKDAVDNEFATRESNVFVIGQEKPWVSLPKGKGVKVRPCIVSPRFRLSSDTLLAVHCRGAGSPSRGRPGWSVRTATGRRRNRAAREWDGVIGWRDQSRTLHLAPANIDGVQNGQFYELQLRVPMSPACTVYLRLLMAMGERRKHGHQKFSIAFNDSSIDDKFQRDAILCGVRCESV